MTEGCCRATPPNAVHPVASYFTRLGDLISSDLGESREAVRDQLVSVAMRHLADQNPSAHICHADIIDYVLGAESLCLQADLDARFAEPPVSLYRGAHFDISALTWLDGTTSIHQHAFCGAFHVLAGASIHSRYHFTPIGPHEPRQRAIAGKLALRDIEVLKAGDTRSIDRGDALIHSLFHMVRPSVTIVVRTITDDPETEIQYDYRWPGLAYDPFHRHAPTLRRQQYLRMLRTLDMTSFRQHCTRVLAKADLNLAYAVISEQLAFAADPQSVRNLADQCDALDLEIRDLIHETALNDVASRTLVDLRRKLHDPDHRFLLALLLNVFDREVLLGVVTRERGVADPVACVIGWLREMTGHTDRFPNLLGLDFNDTVFEMLEAMWRGAGFEATLAALAARHGEAAVAGQRAVLRALFDALCDCPLFFQVFRSLPH